MKTNLDYLSDLQNSDVCKKMIAYDKVLLALRFPGRRVYVSEAIGKDAVYIFVLLFFGSFEYNPVDVDSMFSTGVVSFFDDEENPNQAVFSNIRFTSDKSHHYIMFNRFIDQIK